MTRYADLDKVLELVNEVNADGDFTSYANYTYLFDSIDNLPTIEQPHWIPCSERLPEEDVYVLICYKYKEGEGDSSHVYIDMTSYGQAYFGGRKCSFKEWRSPFEYFHANYEVVAWMPLPEPYGGESDE